MNRKNMHVVKCLVFINVLSFTLLAATGASALDVNVKGSADANSSGSGAGVKASVGANSNSSASSSNSLLDVQVNTNASVNSNANATGDETTASANADSTADSNTIVVSSIDTSENDEVSVTYKRPAWLFGFIRVNINEKATVQAEEDASPQVKVRKSWWSFLTSSEARSDDFETALQSRIASNSSISSNGEFEAYVKSQYVADIQAAAKATYGASVSE